MNRLNRRANASAIRRRMKGPWQPFRDITGEAYKQHAKSDQQMTNLPEYVLENNRYQIQVFLDSEEIFGRMMHRVLVRRHDSKAIHHGPELNLIKKSIFGKSAYGIESYPPYYNVKQKPMTWMLYIDPETTSIDTIENNIIKEKENAEDD